MKKNIWKYKILLIKIYKDNIFKDKRTLYITFLYSVVGPIRKRKSKLCLMSWKGKVIDL